MPAQPLLAHFMIWCPLMFAQYTVVVSAAIRNGAPWLDARVVGIGGGPVSAPAPESFLASTFEPASKGGPPSMHMLGEEQSQRRQSTRNPLIDAQLQLSQ